MSPLPVIIPPDPIEANVDYRYDGCYQSMVLVLLQRIVDASDDTDLIAKLQEIIDALTTLNGKVATEATLALIEAITAQMNFTGGALDVNATISTAGLATEPKQDDQIVLETAANVLLTSIESKDFATETTLAALKVVTDNIKLDTVKLDVNLSTRASEATQELIRLLLVDLNLQASFNNAFGDNSASSVVPLTDVSAAVLAANTDRKETTYYNDSNSDLYLFFGTPAVFGVGIRLIRQQQYINDKYRGVVTAIMDTGKTGSLQVTDVLL
jgi:hypothetical protein